MSIEGETHDEASDSGSDEPAQVSVEDLQGISDLPVDEQLDQLERVHSALKDELEQADSQ